MIPGVVLSRSGAYPRYRITAMMHLTLRQFTDYVRYDPSNPPLENFEAIGMKEAHDQTQQDFKGTPTRPCLPFRLAEQSPSAAGCPHARAARTQATTRLVRAS
jgi:hypothetical protein